MSLNNDSDAENFSFCFIAKYNNINETLWKMKDDFEKRFNAL